MEQKANTKHEFSWSAAEAFAEQYVENTFRPFLCDNMTKEFYKTHEKPSNPTGWGVVIANLKAKGKIKANGAELFKPHEGGPMRYGTIWISKVYSEQQSTNRRSIPGQLKINLDGKV